MTKLPHCSKYRIMVLVLCLYVLCKYYLIFIAPSETKQPFSYFSIKNRLAAELFQDAE